MRTYVQREGYRATKEPSPPHPNYLRPHTAPDPGARCPSAAGPRWAHHSNAHGFPLPAKCPTFTHSVAPIRIRRANG